MGPNHGTNTNQVVTIINLKNNIIALIAHVDKISMYVT